MMSEDNFYFKIFKKIKILKNLIKNIKIHVFLLMPLVVCCSGF